MMPIGYIPSKMQQGKLAFNIPQLSDDNTIIACNLLFFQLPRSVVHYLGYPSMIELHGTFVEHNSQSIYSHRGSAAIPQQLLHKLIQARHHSRCRPGTLLAICLSIIIFNHPPLGEPLRGSPNWKQTSIFMSYHPKEQFGGSAGLASWIDLGSCVNQLRTDPRNLLDFQLSFLLCSFLMLFSI